MSMIEDSLLRAKFPVEKLHEWDNVLVLSLLETIKRTYNKIKKEERNKKVSRQRLMDRAVLIVYNEFKEIQLNS